MRRNNNNKIYLRSYHEECSNYVWKYHKKLVSTSVNSSVNTHTHLLNNNTLEIFWDIR